MSNNEQNQSVAKDLEDKVKAAKALVTAHSLLGVGMFQHRHQEAVKESLDFLGNLHKQVLDDCLTHPDCDKIPELVAYKEEQLQAETLKKMLENAQKGEE